MVTIKQLFDKKVKRLRKKHTKRNAALVQNPQKRGICLRIFVESPKKPNSAKRKVSRVRLCTGKKIRVQIPGEGQGRLQRYSRILVRGGHVRDLPGVRYRVIRGKMDSDPIFERRKACSKYGVKKSIIDPIRKEERLVIIEEKKMLKKLARKEAAKRWNSLLKKFR